MSSDGPGVRPGYSNNNTKTLPNVEAVGALRHSFPPAHGARLLRSANVAFLPTSNRRTPFLIEKFSHSCLPLLAVLLRVHYSFKSPYTIHKLREEM